MTPRQFRLGCAGAVLLVALAPLVLSPFSITLLNYIGIYALAVLGLVIHYWTTSSLFESPLPVAALWFLLFVVSLACFFASLRAWRSRRAQESANTD